MAKTIVFKTKVDNKSSIKSLNQMGAELDILKDKIQETTDPKEFARLSKEIKKAEGDFKDLNKSFEGLDAEAKAGELGKIAGGIGAIGTAAAVVGAGNENIEKLFATFATGIAVTQGVKGAIEAYSGAQKLLKNNIVLTNIATKAAAVGTAIWVTVQTVVTAVIGTTSGALKIFRLALLSTGIGAIIVGIGLLIANFDKVGEVIGWVANQIYQIFKPAIDAVIDALQWLGLMESDTAKATREAQDIAIEAYADTRVELDKLLGKTQELNDEVIAGLDRDIARRKAAGEDTKVIERERLKVLIKNAEKEFLINKQRRINFENDFKLRKARNEITKEEASALLTEIENIKNFEKSQTIIIRKLRNDRSVFDIASRKKEQDIKSAASKVEVGKINKEQDTQDTKEVDDFLKKQIALEKIQDDFYMRSFDKKGQELLKRQQQFDIESAAAEGDKLLQLKLENEFYRDSAFIKEKFENEKSAIEDKATRIRIAKEEVAKEQDRLDAIDDINLARQVKDAKLGLALDGLSAVADLVSLFGKKNEKNAKRAFEINKGLEIAQAVISTYRGANAIFASAAANPSTILFPAQPFITAGVAIVAGLANVAKIASTKFQSGGGGVSSGGAPSVPNITSPRTAPQPSNQSLGLPQLNSSGSESIGGTNGGLQAVPKIQAYVLESDITNSQNNLSDLQNQSEIGG